MNKMFKARILLKNIELLENIREGLQSEKDRIAQNGIITDNKGNRIKPSESVKKVIMFQISSQIEEKNKLIECEYKALTDLII